MDNRLSSAPDMTPEQSIREHLRKNPIKISPWDIQNFFANEEIVSEEYLSYSLEKLAEIDPGFEENNKQIMEELKKWTLLAIPFARNISLTTLLSMLSDCTSNTRIFTFLPDFPKPPASKLLDHIFPDNSLSPEEKILEYEQIAKNTQRILKYLMSWRDSMKDYVNGLETFLGTHEDHLLDEQKLRIEQLMTKSKRMLPQIDVKIKEKDAESTFESSEFERFYQVVSKETKYAHLDPNVARSQIQVVYQDSDHAVRSIVARMAGAENGVKEDKKKVMGVEIKATPKKRSAVGRVIGSHTNGPLVSTPLPRDPNESVHSYSPPKVPRMALKSGTQIP